MKEKMLILTNRTLHNGPRMIREFSTFQDEFDITAIGKTKPANENIRYENIDHLRPLRTKILNKLRRILFYKKITGRIFENYPGIEKYIEKNRFKVIIIHESNFLPAIYRLKKKFNFVAVYNAHEYHPLEFEESPEWIKTEGKYQYALYEKYLSAVDLLVNVCDGIAEKCEKEFQKKSLVIPNVAMLSPIKPAINTGEVIRMIYHGGIMKSRGLETMLDIARILGEKYALDIMAVKSGNNQEYVQFLEQYAADIKNVRFIEPVPFHEIIPKINTYDIGLYMLMPVNFNNYYALPNKLFEFIQAKLAIAIGPTVEMKKVVEKYDLGLVSDDFTAENLAAKIKAISRDEINRYKQNAVTASATENAEHYSAIYLHAIKGLLS